MEIDLEHIDQTNESPAYWEAVLKAYNLSLSRGKCVRCAYGKKSRNIIYAGTSLELEGKPGLEDTYSEDA